MPRPARIQYENAFYHVMNRGRGRLWVFHGEGSLGVGLVLQSTSLVDAVIE